MNLSRRLLLIVAIALLASSQLFAVTYLVPPDEELVRAADSIVIGTAGSSRVFERDGSIYTSYTISLEQVLKGGISLASPLEIIERGGTLGERGHYAPGTPTYTFGERVLVFLDRTGSEYRTLSLGLGKFSFRSGFKGREVLLRGSAGNEISGFSATGGEHVEPVRSADGFLNFVQDVVRGEVPNRFYEEPASVHAAAIAANDRVAPHAPPASAYLLAGVPWSDPRISMRTSGTQSGVSDVNGLTDNSMATWNSDPNSNVNFSRSSTGSGEPAQNGLNEIRFGSTTLPAQFVGFTDLYIAGTIVEADVRIASGVSGSGITTNILTHELGHVLGFRHSDNNEGQPSAPVAVMKISETGRPLQLAAWDVLAVSTVYGARPVCPTNFISFHPQNQTIPAGGSAQLSVSVVQERIDPTTGQWYRGNSGDTSDPIPGATSSTYTTSIPGTYWVRVMNGCDSSQNSNAATVTASECNALSITTQPQSQSIQTGQTATLSVAATGTDPKTYQWRQGTPGGASSPAPGTNNGPQYTTPALTTTTSYFAVVTNCAGSVNSNAATITVAAACTNPVITQQPASVTVNAGQPATFTVAATGTAPLTYQWFVGPVGNTSTPVGTNLNSYTTGPLNANVTVWVRVTNTCPGGVAANSDNATATVAFICPTAAPEPSAPPTVAFNVPYVVSWSAEQGDTQYEIQESTSQNFSSGVNTRTVMTPSSSYNHAVAAPTPYFYRVRATRSCNGILSTTPFSTTARVVVNPVAIPQPPPPGGLELTVPIDSTAPVQIQFVLLPPQGVPTAQFTARTEEPWLSVSPTSGTVTTSGTTLTITAQAGMLPPGSSTAPVFIRFEFADKGLGLHGSSTASVPVGVGKTPPVASTPKGPNVPNNALIFPAVAQVEGLGASFVSDVRLANTSSQPITYRLQFTPSGINGLTNGQRTSITVAAGGSIALNNIVKQFFGQGALPGEGAKGVLEVRPENFSGKQEDPDARAAFATVGSSRTYARTAQGTFGQFIPAISFDRFVGRTTNPQQSNRLSLQQIAQSPAYRTNLGLVEAAGEPATVRVQVFNNAGVRLDDNSITLQPGEHRQIDQYLATRGLTLADGRIEVEVTSETGRVSAYASVLDNATSDPLLVEPARIGEVQANKFIVPGIADIKTGTASWRSDLRIYNPAAAPVNATLRFFPAGAPGSPLTRNVTINANHVLAMDNLLEATFQTTGTGAIHVETPNQSQLVVTARTYDQRPVGTYGQFIPAFTAADSAGMGDRALQILQLEQSDGFRTNLGMVEMSGQPVTVEIAALIPGRATAPVRFETLAPNEFRQLNSVLALMGVPSAFNARVSIRVVGGTGRLAAYGSVVDNLTQDPTYIPSQ